MPNHPTPRRYSRADFKPTPSGQMFYCPGCNACPDDFNIPSTNCPCAHYGDAGGSLTPNGVLAYLDDNSPKEAN